MRIRAEFRKFYRADWRRFRLAVLEVAGNVCQRCPRPHRMLNVARLSHDPADRSESRFYARVVTPAMTPNSGLPRRDERARGQLWLSVDLELAAVPARLLPPQLRQRELFGSELP